MARPKTKPGEERLSPSEWEIMRICWRLGRANVRQILKEDLKRRKRDYRTILTFVSRMAAKGFLNVEKEGNTNYYTAALPQKKGLQRDHNFQADPGILVSTMVIVRLARRLANRLRDLEASLQFQQVAVAALLLSTRRSGSDFYVQDGPGHLMVRHRVGASMRVGRLARQVAHS